MTDSSYQVFRNNDTNQAPKDVKLIYNGDNTYSLSVSDIALSIARGNVEGSEPFGAYGKATITGDWFGWLENAT